MIFLGMVRGYKLGMVNLVALAILPHSCIGTAGFTKGFFSISSFRPGGAVDLSVIRVL
jgi:hypothetical protein